MSDTRTSCIKAPPNVRRIIIKEEYLGICNDTRYPRCAAALLAVFEHWTNTKLSWIEEERRKIEAASKLGKSLKPKQTQWIYMPQSDLKTNELYDLFGESQIARSLKDIEAKGYITTRNNPDEKWDRTLQYRLKIQAVQAAVDFWYASRIETDTIPYQYDMENVPVSNGMLASTEAIPQISYTDSSTEEKAITPAAAVSKKPTSKKKPVLSRGELPERDLLYELVETEIHALPNNDSLPYDWKGRAGYITKWLRGEIERFNGNELGKITHVPTLQEVREFIAYTRKFSKIESVRYLPWFVESWRRWSAARTPRTEYVPIDPLPVPAKTAVTPTTTPVALVEDADYEAALAKFNRVASQKRLSL